MIVAIYGLSDPRDGMLRYVGKTSGSVRRRLQCHVNDVRRGRTYIPRHKWLKELLDAAVCPEIFVIEEVNADSWQEAEQFWISYFKFLGCRLLNATSGGDGLSEYKHTDETKIKQSKSALARYAKTGEREKTGIAVKAAFSTDEGKASLRAGRQKVDASAYDHFRRWARSAENIERVRAMAVAKRGIPLSEETKRRLSIARTGHKKSAEVTEKTAAWHRGRERSPETRANMRAAA